MKKVKLSDKEYRIVWTALMEYKHMDSFKISAISKKEYEGLLGKFEQKRLLENIEQKKSEKKN
jgi:hypothetical protein